MTNLFSVEIEPQSPPAPCLDRPVWSTKLHEQFAATGFVKLDGLIAHSTWAVLREEARRLEPSGRRHDFVMPGYETPRTMTTLGGRSLARSSPALAALYADTSLRAALSTIVAGPLFDCQHPDEFMVLNYLTRTGATHGWHLDDPAYALVLILEAPPNEAGGALEFIPGWHAIAADAGVAPETNVEPLVARCRTASRIERRALRPGETYLLRADRCLHRVTELNVNGARRVALNLAFECTTRPTYGHTATALYDPGEQA